MFIVAKMYLYLLIKVTIKKKWGVGVAKNQLNLLKDNWYNFKYVVKLLNKSLSCCENAFIGSVL